MARIEKEDFSDMNKDYAYSTDGFDKEGRPLLIGFAGEWDIRNSVVTGRSHRLLRYLDRGMEMLARNIRKLQQDGKNVSSQVFNNFAL